MDNDGEKYLIQQHAEDVTDFSSQYGSIDSISYTAQNLTGSSRVFPAYGDHAEAFSMVCTVIFLHFSYAKFEI
jgi:F-box and leucine-rich repeat protein 4